MTRINGEAGTYIVYYPDYSLIVPHSSEIQGLRDAMQRTAQMIFVPYGMSLTDAIEQGRKAAESGARPPGDRAQRRPRKTAPKKLEEPAQELAHDPEAEAQL